MSGLTLYVQATRYTVNCVPADLVPDAHVFEIAVEWRGNDRWAVVRHGQCLDRKGRWSWESLPSSRTDEWLARHRFDFDTALELAKQAAPEVIVNGMTPAQAIARIERLNQEGTE